MVRFYWHVDDGCSAHVPVNGVTLANSEPTSLAVEMDVPGVAASAVGILSVPPCTAQGKPPPLRKVGIVVAHDTDAASWQGALLTSVAQCLARKGFIVMRNYCNLKELRRLRMFEKALDTVSKSPYAMAGGVDSWLLVGVGNGARVAATVSRKAKTNVAGLAVVSYPLHESTPPAGKGAGFPDSTSQLMKCSAPLLVLQGELDARCRPASMKALLRQLRPQQPGPRFGVLPAVDESLLGTDDATLNARTLVCAALLEFAEGLPATSGDDVDLPGIPSVHSESCMLPAPEPNCAQELGVIMDLPLRQEPAAVEEAAHAPSTGEGAPVQSVAPAQPGPAAAAAAGGPQIVGGHLLHVQPPSAAAGVSYPAVQPQHAAAMDGQHLLAVQPQSLLALTSHAAVGVEGPLPIVAPLPLTTGQLPTLPATLVAPAGAPLMDGAVAGGKASMPLFRAEEGPPQPPQHE